MLDKLTEILKNQAYLNAPEIERMQNILLYGGNISTQDRDVFWMMVGQHILIDRLNEEFDLGTPQLSSDDTKEKMSNG